MRTRAAAIVGVAVLAMAACSPMANSSAEVTPSSSVPASCHRDSLATRQPGRLLIATGQPAHEPWVEDDDPTSGKGFEAAVALAVAAELGYSADDVRWTRTTFDGAIAPGDKAFDWNLQQFSVTEDREKSVDFSSPYYTTTQAIVAQTASPIAGARSLSDLRAAMLGAAIGSTSLAAAQAVVTQGDVVVYRDTAAAVSALRRSDIDGVVVDLPTAYHLVADELPHAVIVGQLPASDPVPADEFAILLADHSPLTRCTTLAVDVLRDTGTLAELADTWLRADTVAPVLE